VAGGAREGISVRNGAEGTSEERGGLLAMRESGSGRWVREGKGEGGPGGGGQGGGNLNGAVGKSAMRS